MSFYKEEEKTQRNLQKNKKENILHVRAYVWREKSIQAVEHYHQQMTPHWREFKKFLDKQQKISTKPAAINNIISKSIISLYSSGELELNEHRCIYDSNGWRKLKYLISF